MLHTADGKEYIDGLSALWNVNIGHGRKELADAAQRRRWRSWPTPRPMPGSPTSRRSGWRSGSSRSPTATCAAVYFTTGGAESNESAFKFARYYWKRHGQAGQGEDHLARSTAITASPWPR